MFRVIMYTHSAQLSGAELFLARVVEHRSAGKVLVVLGEGGPLEEVLLAHGVEVLIQGLGAELGAYRSGARVPLRATAGSLGAVRRLVRVLRSWSADVIYTHSAKAHLIGGIAGRLAGVPVVSHAHDLLDPSSRGMWGAVLQRVGFALLPTVRIANSNLTRDSAGWVGRKQWSVIPCPVEPDRRFRPGDAFIADSRPIRLLVLGRIAEWKGQMLALEALAGLVRSGRDVVLDFAGDALFPGDVAYRERLVASARSLGVKHRVRFLGHQVDPYQSLRTAHVVLHTSIRPEPFGQVVLEAMSVGRPVVVSDTAGVMGVLAPWRDCVSYPMGNVGALIAAISRLVDDVSLRHQIGREAVLTAQRFTVDRIVPQLEAILRSAAGKNDSAANNSMF